MSEKFTDWNKCRGCGHEFEVTEELASYRCPQCHTVKPHEDKKSFDIAVAILESQGLLPRKKGNRKKKINAFFDKILGRTELKQRINDLKKGNHDLANQNMAQKGQLWARDKKLNMALDALLEIENATDSHAIQQQNETINKIAREAVIKITK